MNHYVTLVFLLAFLALASSQNATAATENCATAEADLRIAFEERYAELRDATLKRDGKALAALLAPNFESDDVSGKRTDAAGTVEAMLAHPLYFRETRFTTVIQVRRTDAGATVERRLESERVKKILAGMVTKLRSIEIATDEWTCRDNAWLLQRTTTEKLDLNLDGVHVRRVREGM